jgi:hypothetical protein
MANRKITTSKPGVVVLVNTIRETKQERLLNWHYANVHCQYGFGEATIEGRTISKQVYVRYGCRFGPIVE